jgi:hypothetical protein
LNGGPEHKKSSPSNKFKDERRMKNILWKGKGKRGERAEMGMN